MRRAAFALLCTFVALAPGAQAAVLRNSIFSLTVPPADSGCAAPPPIDYYEASDQQLAIWFELASMNAGDKITVRWTTTAGKLDSSSSFAPVKSGGTYCFWLTEPLSDNPVTAVSGTWSFQVSLNNSTVLGTSVLVVNPKGTSISRGGVVNAASGVTNGGMIAPGSLLAIHGNALAPSSKQAPSAPLPTSLNGVSVTINGAAVGILSVAPSQVQVQAPWSIPSDTAFVQVNNNGVKTNIERVRVGSTAPGIFYDSSKSASPAKIYRNPAKGGSGGWVSSTNALQRGDTAIIVATGLGAVTNPPRNFAVGNKGSAAALPVTVAFGGARSQSVSTTVVSSSGALNAGVIWIYAKVPNEAPNGSAVPVTVQVAGAVANAVSTTISGTVPASSAPKLSSIGGYPAVNASGGYHPGSAISLSGSGVYTNVRTYVKFSDQTGYSALVPAISVYSDRVISMVPPYLNQSTHTTSAGTVFCSIVQAVAGKALTSNALTLQIAPLYAASSGTGKLTSEWLATLAQGARAIDGGYTYKQEISKGTKFKAVSANQFANQMTTGLQPLVGGAEEVAAANGSSIDLGTYNNQSLSIDSNTIGLTDALIAAVLTESAKAYANSPPVVIQHARSSAEAGSADSAPRPDSTILGSLASIAGAVIQCNMPWNQASDEVNGTSSNCPSPTQAFNAVVGAAKDSLREAVDSTKEDAERFASGVGLMLGVVAGGEAPAIIAKLATTASVVQAMTHLGLYLTDNDEEASADGKAFAETASGILAGDVTDALKDTPGILLGALDEQYEKDYDQVKDSPIGMVVEDLVTNFMDAPTTLAGPRDDAGSGGSNSLDTTVDNAPAEEITGTVTGAAGNGLQNVGVELTDGNDGDTPIATGATSTDGSYDLLVPEGAGNIPSNALFQITVLDESGDVDTFDGQNVDLATGSQSIGTSSVSYDPDDDGDDDSDGSEDRKGPPLSGGATAQMRRANTARRSLGSILSTVLAAPPSAHVRYIPEPRDFDPPESSEGNP